VRSGQFDQRWDHVLVDEAQDLTPAALALCVELCRDPAGLFLTADANQSLYNRGFRWQQVHERLQVRGRSRILRRNYRSTREIAEAAADILTGSTAADGEARQQEYVHSGNPPVIFAADGGAAAQARWLAEQIYDAARDLRLPINAAAVLVPSNNLGPPLAELLSRAGAPAHYMPSGQVNLEERSVKVITLHAAKGLEFPIVAIAHVEADRLPKAIERSDDDETAAELLEEQRRLFYVGCTRAMRHLFICHDRSLPSPFLAQLSDERWLRF
jgi:superfamily I DNA/RNA helicase